jgi:putative endonuclease
MIKNSYGDLYIGITDNPERRLSEHNSNSGANFTKTSDLFRTKLKGEFKIVFLEKQDSLKEARSREIQIKKWRRDKKENLIDLYNRNISTKVLKSKNELKKTASGDSASLGAEK